MSRHSLTSTFSLAGALVIGAMSVPSAISQEIKVTPVSAMERIYPDRIPEAQPPAIEEVPRGGRAVFQFAVQPVQRSGTLAFAVTQPKTESGVKLDGQARVQALRDVLVEANGSGCSKTQAGKVPSQETLAYCVRQAPFMVYEVITNVTEVALDGREVHAAAVRVDVGRDAEPGLYTGTLRVNQDNGTAGKASFSFHVSPVTLPEKRVFDSVHWLWAQPENLTAGKMPAWWSEEHWKLLAAAGATLHDYGDSVLYTPLFIGEHPLISVTSAGDGKWDFDFTRFDRWMETFRKVGYEKFIGYHVAGGNHPKPPGSKPYDMVMVTDPATGTASRLDLTMDQYVGNFLPQFFTRLNERLDARGWKQGYIQAITDEPLAEAVPAYTRVKEVIQKYLPGVGTTDALHRSFDKYSALSDYPAFWFGYVYLPQWKDMAGKRRAEGKTSWIYHACSPGPPHPNRHLDDPLVLCRIMPWIADYCKATGLLHWGANGYRGANPYITSVGPLPDGSTTPGHPPGDNWMFYPTPDGLVGSLRMAALQQGIQDFELLTQLRAKNPEAADRIAKKIVSAMVLDYTNKNIQSEFSRDPADYQQARRDLLEELANRP